jgi:hypothetical protein
MTNPTPPEAQANDRGIIDALLAEQPDVVATTDAADDAALRNALLGIRALAHLPVPEPSAELAAHFAAGTATGLVSASLASASSATGTATASPTAAGNPVASLSAQRQNHHNRHKHATIIGLSLVATIGLGAAAAAAVSPEFRDGAAQVLDTIASTIVSTVTGNPPPTDDTPDTPTPEPTTPGGSSPTEGGILGTDPLIPNPSELLSPEQSPVQTAIPSEDSVGQLPGDLSPLIPDVLPSN